MTTLVPIDGSHSSHEALKYAARSRPHDSLVLLYVSPSARPVDLERGRFLLEDGKRTCQGIAQDVEIETRLEIGDRRTKLPEVAAASGADLVVMGAHGVNALPHVERVSQDASALTEELQRPVVIVLPTGKGIRAASHDAELEEVDELPSGTAA